MEDPIVIFIKGVFTNDIGENFFACDSSDDEDDLSTYDEIPNKYTGMDTWPQKTNLLCGNCCMSHDKQPVFIPDYFSAGGSDKNVVVVKILFCSFPCAATYIRRVYTGDIAEQKMRGLLYVYTEFTSDQIAYIPSAPQPHEIDIIGGCNALYTIHKFRKHINTLISFDQYIEYS